MYDFFLSFFPFKIWETFYLEVVANYCEWLLARICFVNYSWSENELGFGLDNPKVCERGCPGTVGLIQVVKCSNEWGLTEGWCRGMVFPHSCVLREASYEIHVLGWLQGFYVSVPALPPWHLPLHPAPLLGTEPAPTAICCVDRHVCSNEYLVFQISTQSCAEFR